MTDKCKNFHQARVLAQATAVSAAASTRAEPFRACLGRFVVKILETLEAAVRKIRHAAADSASRRHHQERKNRPVLFDPSP